MGQEGNRSQRLCQFSKNLNTAGGYADFQPRKSEIKETGAGGYANFLKTPNTAGGYEKFQFRKGDMKETGAGVYTNFRKTQTQPEDM